MDNDNFLMVDEDIIYSAKVRNPFLYLVHFGCFSFFLIDMFLLVLSYISFDDIFSLILCIFILLFLLLLFFLAKKIISKWKKHKNSFLYITSHGIHWPGDKGYDFIAWNEIYDYKVYSDGYGDTLTITKNNSDKISIGLNFYELCHSNDVEAAIKKASTMTKNRK